jgi:hypothetical protein
LHGRGQINKCNQRKNRKRSKERTVSSLNVSFIKDQLKGEPKKEATNSKEKGVDERLLIDSGLLIRLFELSGKVNA